MHPSPPSRSIGAALCSALLLGLTAASPITRETGAGPFDIKLFATSTVPSAKGEARLVFAASPFGVAETADGRARYDVQIFADSLPEPTTLGAYSAYVAWATTPDLAQWVRLGVVGKGDNTVGPIELNKFLLVVSAERSSTPAKHAGPTVLHGTSPSGWLQSFLTHPLFRGVSP
jgi:hypothetical protein